MTRGLRRIGGCAVGVAACLGSACLISGCANDVEVSLEGSAQASGTTSGGGGGSGPVGTPSVASAGGGETASAGPGGTGGAPSTGPIELATGQDHPARLALDDSDVYFTDVYGGSVNRVAKAGGPTTMIATASVPSALAVNGSSVYYVDLSADRSAAVLEVVPKTGGSPSSMISVPSGGDAIADIGATDAVLYYFVSSAGLEAAPLETQPDLGIVSPGAQSAGIALGDAAVYWWTATPTSCGENCQTFDYTIQSVGTMLGGIVNVLATGTGDIKGLAADAAHVYWIADATLFVGDVNGGLKQILYTGAGSLGGVAADGTDVYVTDTASGTVVRVSPASGGATTIASMQFGPQAIAVDTQAVYWANFYGGSVMKLSKF